VKVAYIASRYPHVSHTFIRREVESLRALGVEVHTFSTRPSETASGFGPADELAAQSTTYLLPVAAGVLVRSHLQALRRSPSGYVRTLAHTFRGSPPGVKNHLWRLFYLVEGILLWAHCRDRGVRHVHAHFANVGADVARVAARFGSQVGRDGPWSWSFTMHGATEFYDVADHDLAGKSADADAVLCISDYCRSQLMYLTQPEAWERFHVVHCGVDLDAFRPSDRSAEAGEPAPLRVLAVGRLTAAKGFQILIEAVADLVRRGVDIELTIAGEGPDRRDIEKLVAELGVGDRVRLPGMVPPNEVRAYYDASDVFCLSSFAEGVPVVLMEAMACGLPVVSSGITGVPELVEEGVSGFLVPPARPDLLADALDRLTDPAVRSRMGEAGRSKVGRSYDIAKVGPQVRAVLELMPGCRT
jgi:colanic acid/amylovoran biosynthesis glycosyltransferase